MSNTNPPPTTTFQAFPKDKQDALARAQAEKLKSVAHLPKKVNIPGIPNVPMMTPVEDHGPMVQQQPQQRPGLNVYTPQVDQQANAQASALFAQARQQQQPYAAPIPEPMHQVPNAQVGFTNAIADAESMSLALPSRFAFYGFKDFYARPFVTKHIAKLQKAHREQSLLPIVEAVSSVCFTTDPAYQGHPIAFDLSLPDFFFVLYWLRMNSFTKSNYVHTTKCDNEVHLKRVENGLNRAQFEAQVKANEMTVEDFDALMANALPESSLNISQIVTQTDLRVNELETVPDPDVYHFSETSSMYFRPPTVRDVIEFAESPQMADDEQRQEFAFLAQLATHIQHRDTRLSLDERVEIVGNAEPDYIALIKGFEKAIKGYGVVEKIKVQCKECGASRETKLSIAAHSFFPAQ